MKRYVVTLDERAELSEITTKGSHLSQKVINALLNCDEGAFNECQMTGKVIAGILRISMRKVDRVKKRFVEEGLEAVLGGRRRPTYMRKADGTFEARGPELWRTARGTRAMVVAAAGRPRCRAWLRRVTRDGAACSKKNCLKPWQRVGDSSSRERRHRRALPGCHHHHPGDGQSQHSPVPSMRPTRRTRPCGTASSSSAPPSTAVG